jgi:hypothetical protein
LEPLAANRCQFNANYAVNKTVYVVDAANAGIITA